MRSLVVCSLALGCGSSAAPATTPDPDPTPAPTVAADAAAPDAGIPAELASAPAWIFRYNAPGRVETWTLRHHGEQAIVEVARGDGATPVTRYLGTARDGASLVLALAAGPTKLALDCKRGTRPIGARCGDTKAAPIEILDCFHPDFASPMTFGPAPGVEFLTSEACTGYRLLP